MSLDFDAKATIWWHGLLLDIPKGEHQAGYGIALQSLQQPQSVRCRNVSSKAPHHDIMTSIHSSIGNHYLT